MNIGELMVRYLTKHLNLRLSNWMSAPAADKNNSYESHSGPSPIFRIGFTKDEPMAPAA